MTTLFKEKRPAKDLAQILKESTPKKQQAKKGKKQKRERLWKYPSDEKVKYVLDTVFNMLFAESLNDFQINSCKMLSKHLTACIAHYDVVEMAMQRVTIEARDLTRIITNFGIAPDELKSFWLKRAKKYLETRDMEAHAMKELFERQALHLDALDDNTAEKVLDLEDSEAVIAAATSIRSYIKPTKELDDNKLMTPTQISEYLIQQSKGTCIHWPHRIGQELLVRGFKKSEYVNAYYVELV